MQRSAKLSRAAKHTTLRSTRIAKKTITIPNRGKKKKSRLLFKQLKEELILGPQEVKPQQYTHDPLPADKAVPITSLHMPAQYPGYQFRHRLNEFTIDSLSPAHKRFCDLPDGTGSRYSMIAYQRTKPFVVQAKPRRPTELVNQALRDEGRIPCSLTHVLNGKDQQINFSIDPISLEKYKLMKASWAIEWHLDIEGFQETFRGFLRDWQIDPVTRQTGSMRFVGASAYHPTHVHLPMEFEGHEDGNASKKGAMMLTPHTNIQGIFDPSVARRLGTGTPPLECIQITFDREPHHTVRSGDIALPLWFTIPPQKKWAKHVLMTFTKDGK